MPRRKYDQSILDEFYKPLGDKLFNARMSKGMTIGDAAERTGLGKSSIWGIENGKQYVAVHQLNLLCECYNINASFEPMEV